MGRGITKLFKTLIFVIPAQAGISAICKETRDSRFRGNDTLYYARNYFIWRARHTAPAIDQSNKQTTIAGL